MTTAELWAEYDRLAAISRFMPVTAKAWAIDEAMSFILNHIQAGTENQCAPQQIQNKIGNAAAKHRQRHALGAKTEMPASTNLETIEMLEASIEVEQRLTRCSARERFVLIAGGIGYSMEEIANELSVPEGSAKTWAYRGRAKFAA